MPSLSVKGNEKKVIFLFTFYPPLFNKAANPILIDLLIIQSSCSITRELHLLLWVVNFDLIWTTVYEKKVEMFGIQLAI
jgi:hypothetical protein